MRYFLTILFLALAMNAGAWTDVTLTSGTLRTQGPVQIDERVGGVKLQLTGQAGLSYWLTYSDGTQTTETAHTVMESRPLTFTARKLPLAPTTLTVVLYTELDGAAIGSQVKVGERNPQTLDVLTQLQSYALTVARATTLTAKFDNKMQSAGLSKNNRALATQALRDALRACTRDWSTEIDAAIDADALAQAAAQKAARADAGALD